MKRPPGFLVVSYLVLLIPSFIFLVQLFQGRIGIPQIISPFFIVVSLIIFFNKQWVTLWWISLAQLPILLTWFLSLSTRGSTEVLFYVGTAFIAVIYGALSVHILRELESHHDLLPVATLHLSFLAVGMGFLIYVQEVAKSFAAEYSELGVQLLFVSLNIPLGFAISLVAFLAPHYRHVKHPRELVGLLIPLILFLMIWLAIPRFV